MHITIAAQAAFLLLAQPSGDPTPVPIPQMALANAAGSNCLASSHNTGDTTTSALGITLYQSPISVECNIQLSAQLLARDVAYVDIYMHQLPPGITRAVLCFRDPTNNPSGLNAWCGPEETFTGGGNFTLRVNPPGAGVWPEVTGAFIKVRLDTDNERDTADARIYNYVVYRSL